MWWLWSAFLLYLALAAATAFLTVTVRRLTCELADAEDSKKEMDDFLENFTCTLQGTNGITEALHGTARHICEEVESESAAIYEVVNDELVASGVSGPYSLLRSNNRQILTRPRYLFETLKNDRIKIGERFLGRVASSLRAKLVEDGSLNPHFSGTVDLNALGSVMAVPLLTDGVLKGVVCAVNNRRGRSIPFSQEQFARLKAISSQVTLMQELVRGYREMSRRDRIDQELEFARQIQFSLLPEAFPAWGDFGIYAFTRSAKEVDGDFYDFVEIDENRMLVVIGDACGKGVPACMLTAMTRSFIRVLADSFTTLSDFLIRLNDKVCRDTDEERFVTLGCCLLDKKNSLLEFARAGHTELLTFVRNHIRVIYPEGPGLGILPHEIASFDTFCMAFDPEMSVLVFSDGITEAISADNEEFGLSRLQDEFRESLCAGDNPRVTIERILKRVDNFSSEQLDDQTLILIRHL